MKHRIITIATIALLALATNLAIAGESKSKARAGKLLTNGNKKFASKDYEAALALYESAFEAYPSPKILYNMAKANRALGSLLLAAEQLERFLAETGYKEGSKPHRLAKEELFKVDEQVGKIVFESRSSGAEIELNGAPIGELPLDPMRVMPGNHTIKATLADHQPKSVEVTALAGATVTAAIDLERIEVKPKPKPKPPELVEQVAPPSPKEEDSILAAWWFWTAIGVVVVGGVGITVAVASGSDPYQRTAELDVSSTRDWERF